jgi:ssDNA-binding replication factor A large subunit
MDNYNALLDRIVSSSGIDLVELERRIDARRAKLSGLISKEGAAQIIAAELGVNFDNVSLKISELIPGMRKANFVGKVVSIFPVREFERNGRHGKVANLIVADESGNVKVVLWDTNHISLIESGEVKQGSTIEILNAAMREGEAHLSGFSEFKVSSKVIGEVKTGRQTQEKTISELQAGQNVKIRGVVVQLFNPRFFNVCPECGKKVIAEVEGFSCQEHGKVQPKERALMNFVLDDGTENVRAVLFSEQISKIIPEDYLKDLDKMNIFREDFLGSEYWLSGSVRKNQLFNSIEIIGSDLEKVSPAEIIALLEKK